MNQNSTQLDRPIKKSEKRPNWLHNEEIELYDQTDLEYSYFLLGVAQVVSAKRDDVPVETLHTWYRTFLRRGWTKEVFDQRVHITLAAKLYGTALKIDDWINSEEMYNPQELQMEINKQINKIISLGRRIAFGYVEIITDKDRQNAQIYAAGQVMRELQLERERLLADLEEEQKKKLREEYGEKKKRLQQLGQNMRESLAQKLIEQKIIDPSEKTIVTKYIQNYADLIPEELI